MGHCVLVFAFVPTLASLPAWLWFEVRNPLNASDPVVLTFLPVRGAILLLHAFRAGVANGVLAGCVDGLLVSAWVRRRGVAPSLARRLGLGALGGALAAAVVVGVTLARATARGSLASTPLAAVAFELGAGVVCGLIAAPTAFRLAAIPSVPRDPEGAPAS